MSAITAIAKAAFSTATGFLSGIQAYLIVGALSAVVGGIGTWRVMSWKEAAAEAGGAKETVRLVVHEGEIQQNLGVIFIPQFIAIATNTGRIQQEIPDHVTPHMDIEFPVPLGFVRVFNDASHGPVPGPAAGGDADPSGVPLSDVAHAHAADEGTLDQCRALNDEWWTWYDQHKASWNKATKQ